MSDSMIALNNYVNGREVCSTATSRTTIFDPVTGRPYATAPKSNAADVDEAFQAATVAFRTWKEKTPAERQLLLLKIADALLAHKDELAMNECKNCGKPTQLTIDEELVQGIDQIRFFAGACRVLEGKAAGCYMPGMFSMTVREPVGVCAAVTPWNYPFLMAVWKWAPALAAGNTMVLKPSDSTPVSTLLMARLMGEILPPGVFNVVCGERETGELLVRHGTPVMVSITGSVRAGREVAAAAAPLLKRIHLELGGKAPVVVFADADLATAAADIAVAGFFNAGQDCTAATRVVVEATAYERVVALLAEQATSHIKTGAAAGMDAEDVLVGPLNSRAHFERVKGFLARMPAHARVVAGGAAVDGPGFFIKPTVVAGVRQGDEIVQEEVFGPIITVQPFTDEAEAIAMANGVEFGLASSVWTSDHARALRCARAFDFGCVWINAHIPFVSEMPHGGFKQSGNGKDLSTYSFEEYTRVKHVMSSLASKL